MNDLIHRMTGLYNDFLNDERTFRDALADLIAYILNMRSNGCNDLFLITLFEIRPALFSDNFTCQAQTARREFLQNMKDGYWRAKAVCNGRNIF